jgi:hypothetical protein
MSTFGLILILLGAATISVNLIRLIDHLDHPTCRRRTAH